MRICANYAVILTILVFCDIALCLENTSVVNPVGSGTTPPSSSKSGLIPTANPVDASGNLVVTGNVANGMQFRGVVPYNSPTNFYSSPGSVRHTSAGMDSFLKDSAGSQNFNQSSNSGGLTPFYSPSWTVTTMQPSGVISGPAGSTYNDSFAGTGLPNAKTGYYRYTNNSQISKRPLSLTQEDLEKLVESDITSNPVTDQTANQAQKSFWRDKGVKLERKTETLDFTSKPELVKEDQTTLEMLLGGKTQKINEKQDTFKNERSEGDSIDVYDRMKISFGKLSDLSSNKMDLDKQGDAVKKKDANESAISQPGVTNEEFAKAYKSFVAFSGDKFNRHMKAAESFMKQGRFYRAADAYTLASIYKPEDPLGYAGKSLALFGSGEYLSSALFLARALEIFPEYSKLKVDLGAMIGDKDTVENRILEAREWMERSDSGELEFLLSYIYYQMDRMEFARQSIEKAAAKMPDSPAVMTMKKTIDERISKL